MKTLQSTEDSELDAHVLMHEALDLMDENPIVVENVDHFPATKKRLQEIFSESILCESSAADICGKER